MADVKKIATRESYGNALADCGKDFPNLVVLDADLAGATKTSIFQKAFPDRHIDCGIAECSMTGIAAVNPQSVVIHDYYQIIQLTRSGKHGCLPHLAFLNFSVSQEGIYTVILIIHLP